MKNYVKDILAVAIIAFILPVTLYSWSTDPTVNTAICDTFNYYTNPTIVSAGSSGAIIAWEGSRPTGEYTYLIGVFAQKVDSLGNNLWQKNGVRVCSTDYVFFGLLPAITDDGAGGTIIVWNQQEPTSYFTHDIYAQRLDADGIPQWTSGGVAVCAEDSNQARPRIVSDGAGGAIIVWYDERKGEDSVRVYGQRIDADGSPQWATEGIPITTWGTLGSSYTGAVYPTISDGSGGAIIVWRNFSYGDYWKYVYAQRVDAGGNLLWDPNGAMVCTTGSDGSDPAITSDGSGGAIIAWGFEVYEGPQGLLAQRIDSSGTLQWGLNGALACSLYADDLTDFIAITTDDAGGAIMAWGYDRFGTWPDIFGQRIDANGSRQWGVYGKTVFMSPGDSSAIAPMIIPDGSGGAVIGVINNTWLDYDLYAQRVDADGITQWTTPGVAICTHDSMLDPGFGYPNIITTDQQGGAIFVWQDKRNYDPATYKKVYTIYAQRVMGNGELGPSGPGVEETENRSQIPEIRLMQNYPNPFNQKTVIRYSCPCPCKVSLKIYDVCGKLVRTLVNELKSAGAYTVKWNGEDMPSGLYFYQLKVGQKTRTKKLLLIR
ncbi:T9SS type A sorting domain-containing protein [candidate division WOR-3 bacterium]|nr:T9SS type A sorting domain-containing protein [candidate division WOR-3 bacterium]